MNQHSQKLASVALGLSLAFFGGCKNEGENAASSGSKNDTTNAFVDKGEGVFIILGGGDDSIGSASLEKRSIATGIFSEHLATFRHAHPELEIETIITANEANAHYYNTVILTRPNGKTKAERKAEKNK